MRIVKEGSKKAWSMKAKCAQDGGCGATVELEYEDLFNMYREHYWGETDTFICFECPQCGLNTTLKDESVPWHIKHKKFPSKAEWLEKRDISHQNPEV